VKRGLQILSEMSQMTSEVVYPIVPGQRKILLSEKKNNNFIQEDMTQESCNLEIVK
jgi:hypothetical protein